MTFHLLQLTDKSFDPTYTPGPCVDIPEWREDARNEGSPLSEIHTVYSGHQDADTKALIRKEASNSGSQPIPKDTSVVSCYHY
jgi:hypothetical protein